MRSARLFFILFYFLICCAPPAPGPPPNFFSCLPPLHIVINSLHSQKLIALQSRYSPRGVVIHKKKTNKTKRRSAPSAVYKYILLKKMNIYSKRRSAGKHPSCIQPSVSEKKKKKTRLRSDDGELLFILYILSLLSSADTS